MSECRTCGAAIIWATTRTGKLAPFDREPDPDGLWAIVPDTNGKEQAMLAHETNALIRYTSHFSTCPNADKWRK